MFLTAKGPKTKIKMSFSADFSMPPIVDLNLHIDIDLTKLADVQSISKKYWRKVQCGVCGGNGGLYGQCRTCTLCEGKGYALHNFKYTSKSKKRSIDQWTETQCGSCKGKGCHPIGKCTKCGGEGTNMEELEVHVSVPAFAHHGWNVFVGDAGHQEGNYTIKHPLFT